jgi:hypothetical protein
MGTFPGIVDFSPAAISADSARLYAHAWIGGAGSGAPGTVVVNTVIIWEFTFARADSGWVVRRVE